jgi:CBS domain-containing protein
MTRQVETIDADLPLDDMLERYFGAQQRHRAFPVTRNGMLLGVIERAVLDETRASGLPQCAADMAQGKPLVVATPDETCRTIATRMAVHGVERMPVVESKASARLVGIISRSDLVKPAAVLFDEEHLREKFRTSPFAELQRRFKVSRLP